LTRSRPQNSILAVATLGVYLGLILAGGAPSILAQAATAKQFNIKDEIVKRDDLDNDPNLPQARKALESYLSDTEEFLETLAQLAQSSPDLFAGENLVERHILRECDTGNRMFINELSPRSKVSATLERPLLAFTAKLTEGYGIRACTATQVKGQPTGVQKAFGKVIAGERGLFVEVHLQVTGGDALPFRESLQTALSTENTSLATQIRVQLLKSTAISRYNDSIMIATELPRGSLDTLLASK
jgi:hypothetical protein